MHRNAWGIWEIRAYDSLEINIPHRLKFPWKLIESENNTARALIGSEVAGKAFDLFPHPLFKHIGMFP